jgi:hypothetical protein
MLIAAVGAGCRRSASPAPLPTQSSLDEDYCWWTVMRTTLPLDSVATRFERAFAAAGLAGAIPTYRGDTAWVHAGPTPVGDPAIVSESRVVAYRHGDSTHFRHFVAIAPHATGRPQRADTSNLAGHRIGLCARILRAAAIPSWAPREPTGEETLDVWKRRP